AYAVVVGDLRDNVHRPDHIGFGVDGAATLRVNRKIAVGVPIGQRFVSDVGRHAHAGGDSNKAIGIDAIVQRGTGGGAERAAAALPIPDLVDGAVAIDIDKIGAGVWHIGISQLPGWIIASVNLGGPSRAGPQINAMVGAPNVDQVDHAIIVDIKQSRAIGRMVVLELHRCEVS